MPQRIPIRLKLTAALAIPIAALLVVAALEVLQSVNEAREVREQTELAEASIGPAGFINNLQEERNFGTTYLIGSEGAIDLPVESFAEAKQNTDETLETFRDLVESQGGDVAATYQPAFEAFERVADLRQTVDTFEGERSLDNQAVSDPVYQAYTEVVAAFFEANTQVALAIDDPTLRRGAELSDMASRQTDAVSRLVRSLVLAGVSEGNVTEPEEIALASSIYGEVLSNQGNIRSLGNTGPYREATVRLAEESDSLGFVPLVAQILEDGDPRLEEVFASVSVDSDFSYRGYISRLEALVSAEADDLTAAAEARERWYLALAALALIVALVVTWLISRSITQPLRSLTGQAKEMAEHRLPDAVLEILETPLGDDVQVPHIDPVKVRTRDEVADVAEALNTVQDSALDLAVEQAVLRRNIADSFVNLGRRNQNLLGRQLDFITELESNETDPDTLASLFRLDHLATRMRRNAESLLVLAGIDPPRKWAAPVRLTDVIRAALGEVEDYQRVTVRGVEPATIIGSAAADLAHLIAEFIENALTFSPPDQNVDIRGRHRSDNGGYTLAIIDSGLGMPPADIAQANRRLAGAESFTVAPSKYLGHYVAGNLASRHEIHLQLDNSPGNGVTATIDLPQALLTAETPTGDPITDPHGTRAVMAPATGIRAPGAVQGELQAAAEVPVEPAPAFAAQASPQPARTASGLVKRAPRVPAQPAPSNVPDSDLLATLSTYASNIPAAAQRRPILPGNPGPMSSLRASPNAPASRAPGAPGAPGPDDIPPPPSLLRQPQQAPQGPQPPAAPQPPSAPTQPAWGGAQPAAAPPPAAPPGPPPAAAPPAAGGPTVGGNGPMSSSELWAGLAKLGTGPRPAIRTGGPTGNGPGRTGAPPPQPRLDPGSGGTTPGGLARRVRGAQLPTTQPVSLRRGSEHAAAGTGGYGREDRRAANGNGDAVTDDDGPAKDVYSFLSSFTAGVQRGLDEARGGTTTPEDDS